MDGTVADYQGEMERAMAKILSPGETLPEDYHAENSPGFIRNRIHIIRNQPGFWENLPVLEEGMRLARLVKSAGFEVHVLTKGPTFSPNAWTEKLRWCQKHLDELVTGVTMTRDKGLVYGRILMDDFPDYCTRWLTFRPRGLVLLPDRPWNQGFEHPQVMRVLPDTAEELLLKAIEGQKHL